jgi:molecular chaperone GrpE
MPTKKSSEPKKPVQETFHSKAKKIEEENKQLQQDVKEKNDKFLRTLADYQNYQKRMEKELMCREDELKKKYLCELLDFQELLKKAYQDNNPKEGLKLLLCNLEKFFEKEGVTSIECKGKPFDYMVHDAVSTVETVDGVDGMVVDEVKKGYLMNGKVLRPCQVIVSKNKETPVGGV